MNKTVHTREIMDMLGLEASPITHEMMLARELEIENRWLQQFKELESQMEERFKLRCQVETAQARIGQCAQSALHNKKMVVPSIRKINSNNTIEVDEEAVTQIVDMVDTYITMGRDFEIFLQALKDNTSLSNEWENLLMLLKLAE